MRGPFFSSFVFVWCLNFVRRPSRNGGILAPRTRGGEARRLFSHTTGPRNPTMVRAQVQIVCALLCAAMATPLIACKTKAADSAPEAGAAASTAAPPPSVAAADTAPSATASAADSAAAAPTDTAASAPVATPPPAPPLIVETRPPPPPGFDFWVPGYHRWDGRRYVWVGGRWDHRHGRNWYAGHWERGPRGHVWMEGAWR